MNKSVNPSRVSVLAILVGLGSSAVQVTNAQPVDQCSTSSGLIPVGCEQFNAGDTVAMTAPVNSEPEAGIVTNGSGFVFSIDGVTLNADPQVEDRIRRTDVALADADIQVRVDSGELTPRLDIETLGASRAYRPGEQVTLVSETNYPAFIDRAEVRLIDRNAQGGSTILGVVPVEPNGQVTVTLPQGGDVVAVHRVYDKRGRFDETEPLPLMRPDDRGQLDGVEEGSHFIARQNIRVNGGSLTISGRNIAQGARLQAMGETTIPDSSGRAVIQRIVPPGDYEINVAVVGAGQDIGLTRPTNVPGPEWFYVAVADLTYGRYRDGQTGVTENRADGRLQYYVSGETAGGYQITSSADADIDEIGDIFERVDENSTKGLLARIDPSDGYPTYGDNSTIEDDTPTSGNFYLRVEKDDSFLIWGDYQARLTGNEYLRNERTLYGLQGHYETPTSTSRGDAQASIDLYAAQPEQLIGRDVFQGTGGSVYFLRRQDVTLGTATLSVERRDAVTGRVLDRQFLVEGRDYQINHVQGVVTLNSPLTGTGQDRLIQTNPGGDETINLVVQYEYTPSGAELDGYAFGGRGEVWATDDLRFGVTAMQDDSGVDEQRSLGADIRYEFGQQSFVQLSYAETEGPGFENSLSSDGGLVFNTDTAATGSGRAFRLEGQAELQTLGMAQNGLVGGYYETREVGFATLDHNVDATTGDETLYGVFADFDASETLSFRLYGDRYENEVGSERTEIGAEVDGQISDKVGLAAGIEFLDETSTTQSGTRTDIAVRLDYSESDDLSLYAFGQVTLDSDGLDDFNRYGLGLERKLSHGWNVGAEISDGTGGLGGRVLATKDGPNNNSSYFGYELDPGRSLAAGIPSSDNGGKYVLGSRRQINDQVSTFAENTYDIFGPTKELIGAYGVTYQHSDFVSYSATLDFGQLSDSVNGDIERRAVTFGVRFEDQDTRARARLEFRNDDYEDPAEEDTNAVFLVADLEWSINENATLLTDIDAGRTEANGSSFQTGKYIDTSIGYALRPVDNERLNLLARYRYFHDDVGQEVDGITASGPVQESHVFSLEGNYDIDRNWTVGGKVGGRLTDSAAQAGLTFSSNDAWIAIANARFHVVHNWDLLLEARHLELVDAKSSESSALAAAYRHFGNNVQVGAGYNFGRFSDDLTDLTFDDEGLFLNLVASF